MAPDIPFLGTYFDEIVETEADNECRAWVRKMLGAKAELGAFVASRRLPPVRRGTEAETGTETGTGAGTGTYVAFLKGSFNLGFRYSFPEGPDTIIRFPKPGHTATALRDEKVVNEVRVLEYLRQNTTIPLPRVHSWGLTAEGPLGLGPFIIMDFVEGTLLTDVLKRPTANEQERHILNPDVDNAMLDNVYRQIAGYLLQLSRLKFPRIGAISQDPDSPAGWAVTGRPLTYNMNELFPTAPFDRASDYFASLASDHFTHLRAQRNLAYFEETVRCRYIARHQFARLIPEYCLDDAGFLLFCDDMRPGNMLVDPETFRITAVLDLEFTNAVPAQFSYNPPWWLLLSSPCHWLDRGTFDEFLALYEPRMEQFLRALEHVEGEEGSSPPGLHGAVALSTRMRESWKTGRFWFDFMARKSLDIDVTYWTVMHEKHKDGSGGGSDDEQLLDYEVLLDDESRAEMELLVGVKMEQAKAYDEEHKFMFSKKE